MYLGATKWSVFLVTLALASAAGFGADDEAKRVPDATKPEKKQVAAAKVVLVVTGTFEPAPLKEVDRSVAVIEARDSESVSRYWTDFLQSDASIDLRQRGANGAQGDVSIRGSSFGQTLVLLNGLRMNDAQTGHHNLDLPVPPDALERIEVLRGAGSTLYGADALGGAVNFITGAPKFSEFRAGAAVGNFGTNTQNLATSLLTTRWSQQLSLWRDFSSGFRPDRDYRNAAAFSDTSIRSALGATHVSLALSDKPFGADQFYGDFNSWERTKAWFAGVTQDLGKKTQVDVGYRRHSDVFVLFRDQPQIYENNHVSESWQLAVRRKEQLGTNATLFYGGEGFHDSIDSTNLGQHARGRGAGYINLDVRALGRWSFSVGAREEVYDGSQSEFSPTVAAGFALKAGWKLKASVSHAFRVPTYTDLYYHDPANVGNPNLKPESAWSYEGGVVWNPGGRWRGEATVFHRRIHDGIDYVKFSPTDLYHATNLQQLNFTGAEGSLAARLPRDQRADLSYTVLCGAQSALSGLTSKYVFNYPTHRAVIGWLGVLPGKIQARSQVGVLQRYHRDPYAVWDAALSRDFGYVRTRLQFLNLTDTHYQEIEGVVMAGRGVLFGLEFVLARKGDKNVKRPR